MTNRLSLDPEQAKKLAKALAHERRARVLKLILAQAVPASPSQIAQQLREPLPAVASDIRLLVELGVLASCGTAPAKRGPSLRHLYAPNALVATMPMVIAILEAVSH